MATVSVGRERKREMIISKELRVRLEPGHCGKDGAFRLLLINHVTSSLYVHRGKKKIKIKDHP